ncbi:hypothetical protein Fmac_001750 [Flemingia macrophylla]|uniref:Uncharacterized protein n=1 Tax=Flemingia macrophylla TaxID=520843 RepID=A0ABD1NKU0_9FABA
MEWIGSEIKKERPKSVWADSCWFSSPKNENEVESNKKKKKKKKKQMMRLDWWASLDEDRPKVKANKKSEETVKITSLEAAHQLLGQQGCSGDDEKETHFTQG